MRILSCFSLLSVLFAASVATAVDERPEVKIGLIFPLTGTMSLFGEDMARALPQLERSFNESQNKYRFKLLIDDGKFGQGNAAITAVKKMVEIDGVQFLAVGSSGEVLQVAPYVENRHVLTVAGFSSNPAVRDAGDYVFRTYHDSERGVAILVEELRSRKLDKVAVLSEEASFCIGIRSALQKFLGESIVTDESFLPGEADFKTLISRMQGKKPQAYYLNVAGPESFITLVREMRNRNIREPLYTYYVPTITEVQKQLGPLLNGVRFLDYPTVSDEDPAFAKFRAEFEKANGPVKVPFNFRSNYNSVKVLFDAIVAVGPDPEKAKAFLYAYDRPSATGRLRFDENGDVRELDMSLKTYGE